MSTGDSPDIVGRIKAVLPSQWFPVPQEGSASPTPILDGVLTGLAWPWSQLYSLIQYVIQQARIATATGSFLDMIAFDFFGYNLTRNINEGDAPFSARIRAAILQPRATRPAMIQALQLLTGRTPKIFVPGNTGDSGGYTTGNRTAPWEGMAYGIAGGWGSLNLPFQSFIIAYRPSGGGIAGVWGYYNNTGAGGGYGTGALEYVASSMIEGEVTDVAIYQTIAQTVPAGYIAWTAITN